MGGWVGTLAVAFLDSPISWKSTFAAVPNETGSKRIDGCYFSSGISSINAVTGTSNAFARRSNT